MKTTILEPSKEIPIIEECDICVIGGSCTGLFAAIPQAVGILSFLRRLIKHKGNVKISPVQSISGLPV